MQKINHIPISEFASITNISRQTLIYYDNINLFKPDFKNEKGYRYYSVKQIEYIYVITLLKELGMSLKEIKAYTLHKSPEQFLKLMYQQKETVQQQKKRLEHNETIIEEKIQAMQNAIKTKFDDITIEEIHNNTFYISDDITTLSDLEFSISFNHFIDELKSHNLYMSQPIGVVHTKNTLEQSNFNRYNYLYVDISNAPGHYEQAVSINGTYMIGYHIGLDDQINETYQRMQKIINQKQLKIGEYIFEEYIFDSLIKNNESEYITKIMIQLEI